MSKKTKKKGQKVKELTPEQLENALFIGRRVAVAGLRSPIMVVAGQRGDQIRCKWFGEDLTPHEDFFPIQTLQIIRDEPPKPDAPPTPKVPDDDPLETLKEAQAAAEAAKDESEDEHTDD